MIAVWVLRRLESKVLGEGGFGKVKLATHQETGHQATTNQPTDVSLPSVCSLFNHDAQFALLDVEQY
eukprot:6091989-Pleurochrysis_carterae.AAC.5